MAEKQSSPLAPAPVSLSDYLRNRKLQQQILHLIVEAGDIGAVEECGFEKAVPGDSNPSSTR